ncbi:MAG: hypothetical protein M0Z77_04055 [Thermoplasmatales archaeon]|nr:hypothetical protein [Thermoplasmatales archaeon]
MITPSGSVEERQKKWILRASYLSPISCTLGVGYLVPVILLHPSFPYSLLLFSLGFLFLALGIYGLAYYQKGTHKTG